MRKFGYTFALLLIVVPFLFACGGDDDDDDATPGADGTTTTSLAAPTGTTATGAGGTGTTSTGSTAEATMSDTTATTGGGTATTDAEGTPSEDATGEATEDGTAEGTEEATEDATGTRSGSGTETTTADTGTTTRTTTSGTSATTGGSDDEERLMDLLLTEDEALEILGDDWSESARRVVEGEGSVSICGTEPFPGRDEKLGQVEADWEGEGGTAGAFENVVEFPQDVADEGMAYVRDAVDCTDWTNDDGETATVAAWDNPDLADLGDDVVAVIVGTEVSGVPVDLHVAFVQTGGIITQVMYASATADAQTAEQTAVDLVTAAVEKVEAEM